MAKEDNLYQHFNPKEHAFVEKLLDLVERLESQYALQLTDFLDPRQVAIARSVLGQAGVAYYVSSDVVDMEYARLILAPDYYELDWEDFEVALVEIAYQGKFSQLTHGQIMGSLLNGLGLKRQIIGDILVAEGRAQVMLTEQMADYIVANTSKMARTGVRLERLAMDQKIQGQEKTASRLILVSRLRLDKLVSAAFKLSRSQAQQLVASGRVKVNYQDMVKADSLLEIGDLVSVRGYGRFRLKELLGLTKQQKQKLMIEETLK